MSNTPINDPFDRDESGNLIQPVGEQIDTSGRPVVLFLFGIIAMCLGLAGAITLILYKPEAQSLIGEYFPSPTQTSSTTPKPSHTPAPTSTITLTPTTSPTSTNTPTRTPTPTATIPILLVSPQGNEVVIEDSFERNDLMWEKYYGNNSLTVNNGHLTFKSNNEGYIGVVWCKGCPNFGDAFYFQAEVRSENDTFHPFGLLICAQATRRNGFYVFQIDPERQNFELIKYTDPGWATLITPTQSSLINKYPRSNTLAINFDHGKMDLFINGQQVDSYTSTNPLNCGTIGFMVEGGAANIFIDNVFAYPIGATATPIP